MFPGVFRICELPSRSIVNLFCAQKLSPQLEINISLLSVITICCKFHKSKLSLLQSLYSYVFNEITKEKNLFFFFSSIIFAYLNTGLILLLHLDQYYEAIRQFTNAIKIDPLNVQAYLCRAQAYHKVILPFSF